MKQSEVEKLLALAPDRTKEISLNEGKQIRVLQRERWIAGPWLVILDRNNEYVHIAYHNIASIRILKNGGKRRQ